MFSVLLASTLTFISVFLLYDPLVKILLKKRIIGIDQQKKEKPILPQAGGTLVILSFFIGIFSFITINQILEPIKLNLNTFFLGLITILLVSIAGFLDDIKVSEKKHKAKAGHVDYRVGLKQWQKPVITFFGSLPLIFAGLSTAVYLPLLGNVDLGIIYTLLLIPLAVVCVSNATNMLAGQNGLEAGMMGISLLFLSIFNLVRGTLEASILSFIAFCGLLAFLRFNFYPAKILPGDSLTYFNGGVFAVVTLLGKCEFFSIIIFLPWILEAFLKAKNGFRGTCLGKLVKERYLKPKNDKIESLTHVVMSLGNFAEKQEVLIFYFLELILCVLAYLIFVWA
ncbi:MAG: hypothetical protein QW735_00985 [archaeon]